MTTARFHWDIATNRLYWSREAHEVLGLPEDADIGSISAFMLHVDATHSNLRDEIIFDSPHAGHREYAIQYHFLPRGRDSERGFMVMERGRWLPDPRGRPAHVFGEIMRADSPVADACVATMLPEQIDPSTGLFCRTYFMKRLESFLGRQQEGRNAALIILSLKNYSVIFDAYGFKAADKAFMEVGRRLRNVMRAGDLLARYGDKRLALLVHDCDEEDLGAAMARFLEKPCHEPIQTDLGPVWPMLALGATIIPRDAKTLSEAIAHAEEALQEAEQQPGNNGARFRMVSSNASRRTRKARYANEVFAGLREHSFTLAYQPVVRADDGSVIYHECLLHRLQPDGSTTPAGYLIPVAEELGLVRLVDMEVLDLALEALREHPQGRLGINVSATTVMDAEAFLEKLTAHADLVRGRLIVEITESSMLSHPQRVTHFIDELHKLDCKVALDDFGAGYTSFKNLRDHHFDIVKLDGAFCENLSTNEHNQHFVRSLIELARNARMEIVAEWVEHEEDAQLLRQWGVHGMQGYLFGMATADDTEWPLLIRPEQWTETPVLPVIPRADTRPEKEAAAVLAPGQEREREREEGQNPEQERKSPPATAEAGPEEPSARADASEPARQVSPPEEMNRPRTETAVGNAAPSAGRTTIGPGSADDESPPVARPSVREIMNDLERKLTNLQEMLLKLRNESGEDGERPDAPAQSGDATEAERTEEASGAPSA